MPIFVGDSVYKVSYGCVDDDDEDEYIVVVVFLASLRFRCCTKGSL